MFVDPTASGVTATFTPVEFAGTDAVVGIEIMFELKPLKVIVSPLPPAGGLTVTVNRLEEPPVTGNVRFRGLGVSVMVIVLAVILTVAGLLLANPSLTINCRM